MDVCASPGEVTNTVGMNKLPQQSQWSRERNRFEWDWVRQNSGKAISLPLQWRHDGRDCVSNHMPRNCLLYCLFRLRWKKASKLRVTGPCAGKSPGPLCWGSLFINEDVHEFCHITVQMCISSPEDCVWIMLEFEGPCFKTPIIGKYIEKQSSCNL